MRVRTIPEGSLSPLCLLMSTAFVPDSLTDREYGRRILLEKSQLETSLLENPALWTTTAFPPSDDFFVSEIPAEFLDECKQYSRVLSAMHTLPNGMALSCIGPCPAFLACFDHVLECLADILESRRCRMHVLQEYVDTCSAVARTALALDCLGSSSQLGRLYRHKRLSPWLRELLDIFITCDAERVWFVDMNFNVRCVAPPAENSTAAAKTCLANLHSLLRMDFISMARALAISAVKAADNRVPLAAMATIGAMMRVPAFLSALLAWTAIETFDRGLPFSLASDTMSLASFGLLSVSKALPKLLGEVCQDPCVAEEDFLPLCARVLRELASRKDYGAGSTAEEVLGIDSIDKAFSVTTAQAALSAIPERKRCREDVLHAVKAAAGASQTDPRSGPFPAPLPVGNLIVNLRHLLPEDKLPSTLRGLLCHDMPSSTPDSLDRATFAQKNLEHVVGDFLDLGLDPAGPLPKLMRAAAFVLAGRVFNLRDVENEIYSFVVNDSALSTYASLAFPFSRWTREFLANATGARPDQICSMLRNILESLVSQPPTQKDHLTPEDFIKIADLVLTSLIKCLDFASDHPEARQSLEASRDLVRFLRPPREATTLGKRRLLAKEKAAELEAHVAKCSYCPHCKQGALLSKARDVAKKACSVLSSLADTARASIGAPVCFVPPKTATPAKAKKHFPKSTGSQQQTKSQGQLTRGRGHRGIPLLPTQVCPKDPAAAVPISQERRRLAMPQSDFLVLSLSAAWLRRRPPLPVCIGHVTASMC